MDDVWSDMSDADYESEQREREWKIMHSTHAVSGFREGIAVGRNDSSQSGFNSGFEEGSSYSNSVGKLLGVVSVLETFYSNHPTLVDTNQMEKLNKLKSELETFDPPQSRLPPPGLHHPPELLSYVERCKVLCTEIGLNMDSL